MPASLAEGGATGASGTAWSAGAGGVIGPDQTARRRPVKTGQASGGRLEILEGLEPGDRIAVAGVSFLREGMKVRDLGDALGNSRP